MKLFLMKTEDEHVLELVRISKAAFESDVLVRASIGDVPPQYDSVEWHIEMKDKGHLFTAIADEKIVGGAIIFPDENDETVYIGGIFVDPAEFKKGYGMAIMNGVETHVLAGRRVHGFFDFKNRKNLKFRKVHKVFEERNTLCVFRKDSFGINLA